MFSDARSCALKDARDRAQFRDDAAFSAPRPARENSLLSSRFPEIFAETVILLDADPAAATFRISMPVLPVPQCVFLLTSHRADYEGSHGIFRPCTPNGSDFLALMRAAQFSSYCSFAYSALASFRMGMSGSLHWERRAPPRPSVRPACDPVPATLSRSSSGSTPPKTPLESLACRLFCRRAGP